MGGEGSIMHMITSLKNNNRRRKKHIPFSNKKLNNSDKEKPIYDFPESTPELLAKIKLDIKTRQKRQRIISIAILLVMLVFIIYIIYKS